MLESFFEAPFTLDRLRSGPAGPYIDGFSEQLHEDGYSRSVGRFYLRSASHVGRFVEVEDGELSKATLETLRAFSRHLPECRCSYAYGGRRQDTIRGARLFFGHLGSIGIAPDWNEEEEAEEPPLVRQFRRWLVQHRGASESTVYQYCRGACDLIEALGEDPTIYKAESLRTYILEHARESGPGATKSLIAAARAFLRYLAAAGECEAGLYEAIPAVAGWRMASQPRSLSTEDVERTLGGCDTETSIGLRDRSVILLLARLALRAGDVAGLRFSDVDWDDGSLVVSGKSQFEVRLPLPQEVGDALVAYLGCRRPVDQEKIFLSALAPFRPLKPGSISQIVRRAMRRAGVVAPSYGSHILRHSAATEMLRQGASLYEIGAVLRHRSYDQTAYYAKVDTSLLKLVAQPWPEVRGC